VVRERRDAMNRGDERGVEDGGRERDLERETQTRLRGGARSDYCPVQEPMHLREDK
jgi:hypothetical protein